MASIHFDLTDKRVVLTEAHPDDGGNLALLLSQAGARLALVSPHLDQLEQTIESVRAQGGECRGYYLNLKELVSIAPAVERALTDFGGLDVLVNNVGYNVPDWAVDVRPEDWAEVVQVNMTGPFFVAQAVGRHMIAVKSGSIVNVGTHAGIKPNVRRAAYGAARSGMVQFTRNLALEWAEHNVRVNAVAPSFIKAYNLERYPEMYEIMRLKNPMRRFATEEDVAGAVVYLASDAASYVTGQVLSVDGGSNL